MLLSAARTPQIGGLELGSLHLAAQYLELVSWDGDLNVLGVLALEAPEQHAEEPARHEVEEDSAIHQLSLEPVLAAERTRPSF
jgi:hypothetical protein